MNRHTDGSCVDGLRAVDTHRHSGVVAPRPRAVRQLPHFYVGCGPCPLGMICRRRGLLAPLDGDLVSDLAFAGRGLAAFPRFAFNSSGTGTNVPLWDDLNRRAPPIAAPLSPATWPGAAERRGTRHQASGCDGRASVLTGAKSDRTIFFWPGRIQETGGRWSLAPRRRCLVTDKGARWGTKAHSNIKPPKR